ncbi:MAG: HAD-IA family hydrolase [Gaiellaceae bacterium]
MAVRGLLFDFDGLIVDTETTSFASWQEVYREHGHELPFERWAAIIGTVGGFDPFAHLEELSGPLDRDAVLERQRVRELALAEVEELRPGVLEYLERARELGLATAIVSSASRDWIDRHLARLERAEHFDAIVTADRDPARAKPRPTLYLEALDRLGLRADEAIAFEDSPNGVRAAKAAGLFCVAVPNGVTASLGLDEADIVVPALADLPLAVLLERAGKPKDSGGVTGARPVIHVAAAIMRRGDEIVMVRQGAPGEEPFWSTPGGAVEGDELVTEGLRREVLEETGLRVVDPGHLAFVVQIDNRRPEHLHGSAGPGRGYLVTVWTFDVDAWEGEPAPRDPDGLVLEARFMGLEEAVDRLAGISWQSLTVKYLKGELDRGSLWLQRWHPDGTVESVGSISR